MKKASNGQWIKLKNRFNRWNPPNINNNNKIFVKFPLVVARLYLIEEKELRFLSIMKKGKNEILIQVMKMATKPTGIATPDTLSNGIPA